MEELLHELYAYIDWLGTKGYRLTLHTSLLDDPRFYSHNIHTHPFCLAVKTNREIWDCCIHSQNKVRRRAQSGELFFGLCHAGVGEYILPIGEADPGGFLSLGGYLGDPNRTREKILHLCECFGEGEARLLSLAEETLNPNPPTKAEAEALLSPVRLYLTEIARLRRETGVPRSGGDTALLGAILAQLEGHCHEELGLPALAARLNASESAISRLFRRKMGMTVPEYRTKLRMEKACRLLIDGNDRIGEIAYQIGYGDANYFSALFRKIYGETPSGYRRRVRTEAKA